MSLAKRVFTLSLLVSFITSPVEAAIQAELIPKPNPPEAGENRITIKIKDESGKPIEDAKVSLIVFMPAMGTMPRMDEKSKITSKGGGVYIAEFDLSMGGTWELTLSIEKGSVTDVSHYSITTGIPDVSKKGGGKATKKEAQDSPSMDFGPDRLQAIGVRFTEAKSVSMQRDIEAVGVVEQDQTHREEVTLRFSGYVVKQFRGRVGDLVKAGDPLFSVYSPDLVTAQSELLLADKISEGSHSLHQAATEKLKNLGLQEHDIRQIKKDAKVIRDIVIRAPIAGTILEIFVREGSAVNSGQVVYIIGDLSKSYIVARVFQQDITDIKVGENVFVSTPGGLGEPVQGKVKLIYPQVEEGAGTANIRIEITEAVPGLRPGAYTDIKIPVDLGHLLAIPAESILYSGRHRYVFIDHGEGILEPREVVVGKSSNGFVQILNGISEGERVAASGTFLLGSEAQLRSALPKWKYENKNSDMPMGNEPLPAASSHGESHK